LGIVFVDDVRIVGWISVVVAVYIWVDATYAEVGVVVNLLIVSLRI